MLRFESWAKGQNCSFTKVVTQSLHFLYYSEVGNPIVEDDDLMVQEWGF